MSRSNLYPDLMDAADASLNNVLTPPQPRPRGRPRKVQAAPPRTEGQAEIRRPDQVRCEQLIHAAWTDEDRMMEEAIALSRAEFAAAEQRETILREERANLRHSLAYPISRLHMWHSAPSTPSHERILLTHILDVLRYRTRTQEEEHILSPPLLADQHRPAFDKFILSLHKSRLYQPIAALFMTEHF